MLPHKELKKKMPDKASRITLKHEGLTQPPSSYWDYGLLNHAFNILSLSLSLSLSLPLSLSLSI